MRFKIKIETAAKKPLLPINYQYPLSAAIYRILAKGSREYAQFLHEKGYGKGYKFFTFSDLRGKFKREGDRLQLLEPVLELTISFHLPEASQTFIEGLFRSEEIVIADKHSKAVFTVQSVVALQNPLKKFSENEIKQIVVRPNSMIVAGQKNEKGNYDFLAPDDKQFVDSLIFNWRNKIAVNYGQEEADNALLTLEVEEYKNPWRSRLVTLKADTPEETKIRGFLNFKLKLTAEVRFLELLLNAGAGLYTAQGMGSMGVMAEERKAELTV